MSSDVEGACGWDGLPAEVTPEPGDSVERVLQRTGREPEAAVLLQRLLGSTVLG